MNVVLTHPTHGAKVAIAVPEMDLDLKNGWVKWTPPDAPTDQKVKIDYKEAEDKPEHKVEHKHAQHAEHKEVPPFLKADKK